MKILHLSDLHLGKNIYGISLIESGDQQTLVDNIVKAADDYAPDVIVIAGDIYDRSNPPEAAVELFERLLSRLMDRGIPVFIVNGNHDSVKRLSYLNETLKNYNVHIADGLSAKLESVSLEDEHGEIVFWLMPYAYPALIAEALGDPDIKYKDYDTAVRALLNNQDIDLGKRNVLIAHQNVVNGGREVQRGGSETSVGGIGGIEQDVFSDFEYTALGHIHAGYYLGDGSVRYCGTPMCYHFDETRQKDKGALLVEIDAKDSDISVEKIVFEPLHPMAVIKGSYEEVKKQMAYLNGNEYIKATLTDRKNDHNTYADLHELAAVKGALLLEVDSTYNVKAKGSSIDAAGGGKKPIDEVFDEFIYSRHGERLNGGDFFIVSYLANMLEQSDFEGDGAVTEAAQQLLEYIGEEIN